jgi:zinc D-Ala-D-Ala carboxypeptidase
MKDKVYFVVKSIIVSRLVLVFTVFVVLISFITAFISGIENKKSFVTQAESNQLKKNSNLPETKSSPEPSTNLPAEQKNEVDPIHMKVDKNNPVGNYVPDDLVIFQETDVLISKKIEQDLINLINTAHADGVDLKVVSGYRSHEAQQKVFNHWVNRELSINPGISRAQAEERASLYSARPGYSEHQLGTVVDLLSKETNYQFSNDPNSRYAKWIEENAEKFNFKVSYPLNNGAYVYEPWHIRWWPNI